MFVVIINAIGIRTKDYRGPSDDLASPRTGREDTMSEDVSEMKILQFQVTGGFLSDLTYWVLREDGSLWWAQPKQGKAEIHWHQVETPREPADQ